MALGRGHPPRLRLLRFERRRLRRLGIVLAVVDLIDLTGFPFTTAAGTYGLLVCRHPDTVDFFEGRTRRPSVGPRREGSVSGGFRLQASGFRKMNGPIVL